MISSYLNYIIFKQALYRTHLSFDDDPKETISVTCCSLRQPLQFNR